ncbi:MAG: hypothetical protein ACP5O1_04020 [Phycisphaerae bacterium]
MILTEVFKPFARSYAVRLSVVIGACYLLGEFQSAFRVLLMLALLAAAVTIAPATMRPLRAAPGTKLRYRYLLTGVHLAAIGLAAMGVLVGPLQVIAAFLCMSTAGIVQSDRLAAERSGVAIGGSMLGILQCTVATAIVLALSLAAGLRDGSKFAFLLSAIILCGHCWFIDLRAGLARRFGGRGLGCSAGGDATGAATPGRLIGEPARWGASTVFGVALVLLIAVLVLWLVYVCGMFEGATAALYPVAPAPGFVLQMAPGIALAEVFMPLLLLYLAVAIHLWPSPPGIRVVKRPSLKNPISSGDS